MKDVRIGCSGWVYDSWRRGIYKGVPQARWLERYAELFDTVEVNNTFYRLVKREAVEGWVERTPPGFLFAVKGSRYLTHMKRLRGIEQGIARFWEPLEPLRESGKLGPVLWGSCRAASTATRRCSARRWSCCRPPATASSSATRAGSYRR